MLPHKAEDTPLVAPMVRRLGKKHHNALRCVLLWHFAIAATALSAHDLRTARDATVLQAGAVTPFNVTTHDEASCGSDLAFRCVNISQPVFCVSAACRNRSNTAPVLIRLLWD